MQRPNILSLLLTLSPLFLFFLIFIGSGLYFSLEAQEQAFYQVSASVAILPAIVLAFVLPFFLKRSSFQNSLNIFLEGTRDQNIIVMCLIYLLAGAFAAVLQAIGGISSIVNIILNCVPIETTVPALFLVAALVSTAMGTSMGTIAAIGPIGVGIANSAGIPLPLTLGAIVGGAMFGDNLSIISDTSIAATQIHGCTAIEKFKNNSVIAIPTMIVTLIILTIISYNMPDIKAMPQNDYQTVHCIPYLAVLAFAISGMNVFAVLLLGIIIAGAVGIFTIPDYTFLSISKNIFEGYKNMTEILILSILIGGLGALIKQQNGFSQMAKLLIGFIPADAKANVNNGSAEDKKISESHIAAKINRIIEQEPSATNVETQFHPCHPRAAEGTIAAIVSVTDICTANNTISIILSGESVRELAMQHHLKPARTATLVDLFSCVFQGLIPYGAQLLMAGALAGISPMSIVPHVHYCYLLGLVGIASIIFQFKRFSVPKWSYS